MIKKENSNSKKDLIKNMTLLDCKAGETLSVSKIRLEEALQYRLQILGIVPGSQVHVLHKKRSGAMVIRSRGARYALGAQAAGGITGVKAL